MDEDADGVPAHESHAQIARLLEGGAHEAGLVGRAGWRPGRDQQGLWKIVIIKSLEGRGRIRPA